MKILVVFWLFVLSLSIPMYLNAQQSYAAGKVYLDENKNGSFDQGESVIHGVKVSNGKDVVKTNSDGKYQIAIEEEQTLFICKPSGYGIPLNESNLPQFYYHYYPKGTPKVADWQWPVIEPTGQLPSSVDFALLPEIVPDQFKALGFADPQTATDEQLDMMRKDIIDALFGNPYGAKFGMVAGDVVNDNLALYERHNRLMAQLGVTMWNVPGNHDLNPESPSYIYASQTFKSVFGPDYYSFNYGKVHFLALNNVGYQGKGKGYIGHIDDRQLQWIENDLEDVPKDHLLMIITHIPLITYANDRTFPKSINTVNLGDLLKILGEFKYVYAIAGHDTSNSWKVEVNHAHNWHGYPFIAHTLAETRGGGWEKGPKDNRGVRAATMEDGNPNGFYLFHFDGHRVRPQFIPAPGNDPNRLRISLDPLLASEDGSPSELDRGIMNDSTFIVVNFFDGGERDIVTISLNGEPALPMQHSERTDPYYVRQFQKYEGTSDSYRAPAISSHIWQWLLPELSIGIHSVNVKAEDEFGFNYEKVFTFEITD